GARRVPERGALRLGRRGGARRRAERGLRDRALGAESAGAGRQRARVGRQLRRAGLAEPGGAQGVAVALLVVAVQEAQKLGIDVAKLVLRDVARAQAVQERPRAQLAPL